MFVYHLTKIFFKMKLSPSKGASMYQVSSNSETKNFSAQKTPKGSLQNFLGPPKKKKLFNKCCRACQQESAYKIIQGSGF